MSDFELAKTLFLESLDFIGREDYANAEIRLREAHRLVPERISIVTNLSAALLKQNKIAEATKYAEIAVALDDSNAEGWVNLGKCREIERDYPRALASFDKAIALKPDLPEAWLNRGSIFKSLQQYDQAFADYDKAIALNPGFAEAWRNRGNACRDLKRYEEALANYEKALALKPDIPYVLGDRVNIQMQLCHWEPLARAFDDVVRKVASGLRASTPFHFLMLPSTPALQKKCAEIFLADNFRSRQYDMRGRACSHERIRIGYFSSDFHNHATAHLVTELFERHDRSKFEVIGFSFGSAEDDAMRRRLESAFDRFIDVKTRSDDEIAELARSLEIDIAVDLKGFTRDSRPGIFARRVAPVQVNYLGYPGTTGSSYMDYLLADSLLIPVNDVPHYTEKIAYLPNSYQVNDSTRRISEGKFARAEAGLPERGFVFCCFNNSYKITPDVFDIWMRLVHKIEGSVLWLLEDNPAASRNLRQAAAQRGILPTRIVFANRIEMPGHLARHKLADLFLDTLYCNAHTTGSDALWSGLPMLTCVGTTFSGRVAASLLTAVGLPELITNTRAEYESLALELATHPERLLTIRQKLARNRETHPLFDTPLFTRHIEAAYINMWERQRSNLPPDHIHVKA